MPRAKPEDFKDNGEFQKICHSTLNSMIPQMIMEENYPCTTSPPLHNIWHTQKKWIPFLSKTTHQFKTNTIPPGKIHNMIHKYILMPMQRQFLPHPPHISAAISKFLGLKKQEYLYKTLRLRLNQFDHQFIVNTSP